VVVVVEGQRDVTVVRAKCTVGRQKRQGHD
jgi:hypothetical protein